MAELDVVQVTNPSSEDFTHNFNGEPYTILAGESKTFAQFVAYHLAKHLSSKLIDEEVRSKAKTKDLETMNSKVNFELAQQQVYDTPKRRIALFKMFDLGGNDFSIIEENIKNVLQRYPFKGTLGDLSIWTKFLAEESAKRTKKDTPKKEESESKVKS